MNMVTESFYLTIIGGAFNSAASCHSYHKERTRVSRLEYDGLLDKALGAYRASLNSVTDIERAYEKDAQQFAQSDGEIAGPEERARMRMRALNNIGPMK